MSADDASCVFPTELPVLRGPRAILRPPEPKDIESIARIGVDAEVMRMFGYQIAGRSELSRAEAEVRYGELLEADPPVWVIEVEGAFIGTTGFSSINSDDRRARFIIGILDARRLGCGLGTEVTQLVLAYGFEVLALHRIDLRVLDDNQRALACYRRCGFLLDGRERESALIGDEWHDDLILSILAREYRERCAGGRKDPASHR